MPKIRSTTRPISDGYLSKTGRTVAIRVVVDVVAQETDLAIGEPKIASAGMPTETCDSAPLLAERLLAALNPTCVHRSCSYSRPPQIAHTDLAARDKPLHNQHRATTTEQCRLPSNRIRRETWIRRTQSASRENRERRARTTRPVNPRTDAWRRSQCRGSPGEPCVPRWGCSEMSRWESRWRSDAFRRTSK